MRSLKLFYLLIFTSIPFSLFAQEVEFSKEYYHRSNKNYEPRIAKTYFLGRNLIYNCFDKHFACVSDLNFDKCKSDRKLSLDEKEVLLPCAPLKTLPGQVECFKLHYTLIHDLTYKGFCLNMKKMD